MCRETLTEEGSNEEEINDEVSIVLAQIGYVNQKMGIPEAASKYYNQVKIQLCYEYFLCI